MEQLKERIRTQDTDTILDCIMQIGGGHVDVDKRMVRAALLDIYQERTSEEDVDALLDTLGM
jgi:hypothetical protein